MGSLRTESAYILFECIATYSFSYPPPLPFFLSRSLYLISFSHQCSHCLFGCKAIHAFYLMLFNKVHHSAAGLFSNLINTLRFFLSVFLPTHLFLYLYPSISLFSLPSCVYLMAISGRRCGHHQSRKRCPPGKPLRFRFARGYFYVSIPLYRDRDRIINVMRGTPQSHFVLICE